LLSLLLSNFRHAIECGETYFCPLALLFSFFLVVDTGAISSSFGRPPSALYVW